MEDNEINNIIEEKFKIHLFTHDHVIPGEIDILIDFLEAGLDRLHIRKPGYSKEVYEELLISIPSEFRGRVVLHDYPELATRFGCCFQFNVRNTPPKDYKGCFSFSLHSTEEAERLMNESWNPDESPEFVTLSPIYDSISKTGYKSAFDPYDIQSINLSRVVALGGVNFENIVELKEMGFSGAALLGEVWHRPGGVMRLLKFLRMRNLCLQFVTNGVTPQETLSQALLAIKSGFRWIQVRMKNTGKVAVKRILQQLMPICTQSGTTLIVDDYADLAEYCHGVHLGQSDMSVSEARQRIPQDKIVGLTVNSLEDIEKSHAAKPDYYGVGPYRFTSTKNKLAPVLGLEGYRRLAPAMDRPFVAIGGIREDYIEGILDAGASGIAVSSMFTDADNPRELTELIYNKYFDGRTLNKKSLR